MPARFGTQYDKRSYVGGKVQRGWKRLTRQESARTDAERAARVEALAEPFSRLTQEELRAWVEHWRGLARDGQLRLDDIVEEAFAVVREASRRTTGLFHYPEQVIGGLILVRGAVAEMATGEGKTLAVSLPAFAFSLFGRGVHCITVNSYLAQRDCEFTAPIFDYLGLTVRHLPEGKAGTPEAKREAYAADVTYGVGYEFGFDYLRDQLILLRAPRSGPRERLRDALLGRETPAPPVVQGELAFAIIDEVDSVLIDEAGSPLVISESRPGRNEGEAAYWAARDLAATLRTPEHYELEPSRRSVRLTREGFDLVHQAPGIPWDLLRRPWQTYILNALRAEHFFLRDASYVVDEEDKICIIDEFTGRRFSERTWRDGLHQAVEAKEHVEIRAENDSSATITRQRYFGLYETICGLTGTAAESAGEFWHFFKMGVETVPLHKPSRRRMLPERVFRSKDAAFQGVLQDVAERHAKGQPVLVGTRTIRASEELAALFTAAGLPFTLLTAKQDAEESAIVALAGDPGHILIATNMAGRGTHIDLAPASLAAGGLHVIAVERNESVRIDRQLIGRGARQGQPGSAQLFVSADDFLIEHYDPALGERIRKSRADARGEVSGRFSAAIDQLQQAVERLRYEQRLALAQRDKWLDEIKSNLA
jgi:preprotein translocase subunit SecA